MKNLSRANIFWFIVVLVVLFVFLALNRKAPGGEEIDYPVFVQKVEDSLVKEVTIKGQQLEGVLNDGTAFETTGPMVVEPVHNLLVEHGVVPSYEEAEDSSLWLNILIMVVPIVAMVFIFLWFMRNLQGSNGRAMSFGKSKAKLLSEGARQVTFADVAGIEESKEELREVVDFLQDPRKFTRLGGRIPKGVLLMGSPGTGKTLLARAVAGEAGVPFYSISGSDFVEMFVGVGASRVRDLFEQGKRDAPCIIFIDEIDAVGRHRGAGLGGGHDEREQTLNQLLVEMDGFEGTEGVILVAATNRPDVLDPALLRPGRFDRRVVVPLPDVKGREMILEVHTRKIPLGSDVDLAIIAKRTPGFSGADVENLCNEAALSAARADKEVVEHDDFETARDKVMLGPERRSMILADHERMSTAIHEAGHAIVAHLLPDYDPVHKVTIIPRGRALGITAMLPDEDRKSWTRAFILKSITMAMGGRAAERLALGTLTSGARSDIQQATKMAHHMVCDLGMSEELGPVAYGDDNDEVFLGRSMAKVKSYSEHTAQLIDKEIKRICDEANDTAMRILSENHHVLQRVADALMEHETLEGEAFAKLVEQSSPHPPSELQWLSA